MKQRYEEFNNPTELEKLEKATAVHSKLAFRVDGNCMAGVNIVHGDTIIVDFSKKPRPPKYPKKDGFRRVDICLCFYRNTIGAKEYLGRWGDTHIVGTHELQTEVFRPYHALEVEKVLGVVYACYSSTGECKWEKNISDFPDSLPEVSTIHGTNCGDPISVGRVLNRMDNIGLVGEVLCASASKKDAVPAFKICCGTECRERWNTLCRQVFLRRYKDRNGKPPVDFERAFHVYSVVVMEGIRRESSC